MASGGYRQPSNPAPVSGPGAMSQRTDGGPGQPVRTPTGLPYGEAGALTKLQQAAPLAADPGAAGSPSSASGPPPSPSVPFGAPTQQPNVPVTSGAAGGAGPGPEALGLPDQKSEDIKKLLAYLPVLEMMANQDGASAAARNAVRELKGYS